MAYFAPYIDSTGFHRPTFADIQAYYVTQAQTIFGSGIYLDNDSQDAQWIAAMSKIAYDTALLAEAVYNGQSPQSAAGVGLDTIVKINGIARLLPTHSTCLVTLVGAVGTVVTSGVVSDTAGLLWSLPTPVTIPVGGVLTVTATAQDTGAITADIGALQTIVTPTFGWTSVSNAAVAVVGNPVETDSDLRARQALSVALPSRTVLEGIVAAVLSVANVTRARGYDNATDVTNADGMPAHNIAIVAEGGTDADVAYQIYLKKTPGAPTYGTTTINETADSGFVTPIKFFRPTLRPIDVAITVKALTGYTTATTAAIKAAIVVYLNSPQIGDDIYVSSIYGAALSAQPSLTIPAFSVVACTAALHGGSLTTSDIVLAFNEASQGLLANVTVTVI